MLEIPTRKDCLIVPRHFLDRCRRVHPFSGLQPYLSGIAKLISKFELGIEKDKSLKDLHQLSSIASPYHTISALRSCQTRLPSLSNPGQILPRKINTAPPPHRRLPRSSPSHPPHIQHHFMRTKSSWTTVERTIFPSEHQSLSSRPRLMAHF